MSLTGDTFDFQQGNVVTSSAQMVDSAATVGDVLTVQTDKSIAAAPGGGSQPHTHEVLGNSGQSIANNAQEAIAWALSFGPDVLLNRTVPTEPTIITSGIYAFGIQLQGLNFTTGGYFTGQFELDTAGEDAGGTVVANLKTGDAGTLLWWSATMYLAAGMAIKASVFNLDGVAARDFNISALVQRVG